MTTYEKIAPIIFETYGEAAMPKALAENLAVDIDSYNESAAAGRYLVNTREELIWHTCWDWFSGGSTAEYVAKKIEAVLSEEN